MLCVWTSQPSANAARIARSTACALSTGSAPGSARQTGHVFAFGASPKLVEHRQKIFVAVLRWTCTSSPTTISYRCSVCVAVISAMRLVAERAFERERRHEHLSFIEMGRQELATHGQSIDAANRDGHRGNSGEVCGRREHVA